MSPPRIAIVGRPNVGKSSLLNMLARERISIVDPTPGVTRDRISVYIDVLPPAERKEHLPVKTIEIIDTGGYGIYSGDEDDADSKALTDDVEFQIAQAIEKADLVLFIIDAHSGVAPLDETIAEMLRTGGYQDRVQVVANKVDNPEWEMHGLDAVTLGLGEPWFVSATSGHNRRIFLENLYDAIPETTGELIEDSIMKLAIVGKRNAGKSTLVNAWAGEDRVIVSEIAGTTRDAVDVRFDIEGRSLIAIDTAGVRKRKSLADDVEYYAFQRALKSIRRSDVVIHLIDATQPVSQVDKKLSMEIAKHYKPCVLVVNKWDLVEDKLNLKKEPLSPEDYLDHLNKELYGMDFAPCAFIAAKDKDGIRDVLALSFNLYEQAGHRETTGQLNEVIRHILERRGPSSRLGKQAKVLYVSQVATYPPTIVMVVNHKELFEGQYERYLMNRLREELPYSEVPIRLIFRDRRRVSLSELKSGEES